MSQTIATQADTDSQRAVSRRQFLASLSAGSVVLMARTAAGQDTEVASLETADPELFNPDLFLGIAPDGTVTILAHRSEMGTGIRTNLPRVVADELDADWDRVVIAQAIGDKRLGSQNTDGSNSVRHFFDRMRVAGATARTMLERAAAQQWNVSAEQCRGRDHKVVHQASGRAADYGQLVAVAKTLDVPSKDELQFKPRSEWRYIGKDAPLTDVDEIVTGQAIYGIDARMDGQLYAVVARPPVVGGKVKSYDDAAAKEVPGVEAIVEIPGFKMVPFFNPLGGVAVVANSTWAAIQGREALEIEWDHGKNASYNSEPYAAGLLAEVRKPGKEARNTGDTLTILKSADEKIMADYTVPHLAHASMEPTCAVAKVMTDDDGKVVACHVISATQNPQAVQQAVAPALKIKHANVVADVTLLGSGFGRKSKPDYCVEAALLSKELGRPVHVTWTREDDIHHDYYHTVSAVHMEAATDENGLPTAWLARAAYPSLMSTFSPMASGPSGNELEMGLTDLPYEVPNYRVEKGTAKAHCRIGWLRSVCHIHQNFAVGSFVDELAHAAERDPYEFLIELLGADRKIDMKAAGLANRGASPEEYPYDIARLKHVTRRVAEMADWSRAASLPKGRGLGIACCRSFLGYTGHVVEVEVTKQGMVRVPKVWVSLDCGIMVNPDRIRAQIEGAAVMATTQVRYGEITFTDGQADQSNYDDYPVATMSDAPREINIDLVENDEPPAGVGETPVPSFAPAMCNAIFAATGTRIRDLPLTKHDLSWS